MSNTAIKTLIRGFAWLPILAAAGCISHDQVYLKNPSPCRVRCHPDYVAPLDPECHGYHATCWAPWSGHCPPCPPPVNDVVEAYPERFEIVPEEVRPPSSGKTPLDDTPAPEPPPEFPLEPIPSPSPAAPADPDSSSSIKVRTEKAQSSLSVR